MHKSITNALNKRTLGIVPLRRWAVNGTEAGELIVLTVWARTKEQAIQRAFENFAGTSFNFETVEEETTI
jgi:septum formation inhibitor-activating ATPase MinD